MRNTEFVSGLKCKICNKMYSYDFLKGTCCICGKTLEVTYDYDVIEAVVKEGDWSRRPRNIWRFVELLPVGEHTQVGELTGYTPLIRADNLGRALGLKHLFIKNDAANYPSMSYKDRVVAVALQKAKDLRAQVIACVSTGNVGNALAAQAARSRMPAYVFYPADVEAGKIISSVIYGAKVILVDGTYDEVNRLCKAIADEYGILFVNINLRPFYAEGAKTFVYEIVEQLGWVAPDHIIVPVAGATLITKIAKGLQEMLRLGFICQNETRIHACQAAGCAPITQAVKTGKDEIHPCIPNTLAKSIAIGAPGDGPFAIRTIRESGGTAEAVTDEEILAGIKLLGRTEGLFAEPAGGTAVAVTLKLVEQGVISATDVVVIGITGNGYKTLESVDGFQHDVSFVPPNITEATEVIELFREPTAKRGGVSWRQPVPRNR